MVTYEQASQMPEFQSPAGRFPYLPFASVEYELRLFGFEAFIGRLYRAPLFFKRYMPEIALSLLFFLVGVGVIKRRKMIPGQLWCFLAAAVAIYLLSRAFAFKLYVPNRHIQIPFALFFISALSIALWRAGKVFAGDRWPGGLVALCLLALLLKATSGSGLNGTANFNYSLDLRGGAFEWLRANTPPRAIVAGQPTFLDPVQLFAVRRGYVTTETAHPFYLNYNAEMRRRLELSFRAHYAANLKELLAWVEPEGITHFVFYRKKFYPDELVKETYFQPLTGLVKELTSRPIPNYAYFELPRTVDLQKFPFMPFRDDRAAVVDIAALRAYLNS